MAPYVKEKADANINNLLDLVIRGIVLLTNKRVVQAEQTVQVQCHRSVYAEYWGGFAYML